MRDLNFKEAHLPLVFHCQLACTEYSFWVRICNICLLSFNLQNRYGINRLSQRNKLRIETVQTCTVLREPLITFLGIHWETRDRSQKHKDRNTVWKTRGQVNENPLPEMSRVQTHTACKQRRWDLNSSAWLQSPEFYPAHCPIPSLSLFERNNGITRTSYKNQVSSIQILVTCRGF